MQNAKVFCVSFTRDEHNFPGMRLTRLLATAVSAPPLNTNRGVAIRAPAHVFPPASSDAPCNLKEPCTDAVVARLPPLTIEYDVGVQLKASTATMVAPRTRIASRQKLSRISRLL